MKEIDVILAEAREHVSQLLKAPRVPLTDITGVPVSKGVYIFYKTGSNKIIYVGETQNLKGRIRGNHLSRNEKGSSSSLRWWLNKLYGIPFNQTRDWLRENCTVAFLEINNSDMCKLVEALAISCHRSKYLLNKFKE
jgi:hypothetical protein